MTLVRIAPAALARAPVTIGADDLDVLSTAAAAALVPADATPDAAIAAGVQGLKDRLREAGLETAALQGAIDDTEFHEDGAQTDGVSLVPGNRDAVAFPVGLDARPAAFDQPVHVITTDGHSHVVFDAGTAGELRAGRTGTEALTAAGRAALEALVPIVLKRVGVPEETDAGGRPASETTASIVHLFFQAGLSADAGAYVPPGRLWYEDILALGPSAPARLEPFGLALAGIVGVDLPESVAAGGEIAITVIVQDESGDPIAGSPVEVEIELKSGVQITIHGRTGADGRVVLRDPVSADSRGARTIRVRAPGLETGARTVRVRPLVDGTFVPAGDVPAGQIGAGTTWTVRPDLNAADQALVPAQDDGPALEGSAPNGNLFVDAPGGLRRIFVDHADPSNGILRIAGWDALPPVDRLELAISTTRRISAACPFVVRLFDGDEEVRVDAFAAPGPLAEIPVLGDAFDRLEASVEGPSCAGAFLSLVESRIVFSE